MATYLLLQSLLICAVFRTGINFKCYICDSKTNPNCMDPLGENMPEVIDCEEFFPMLSLELGADFSTLMEPLLYGCQKLEVQDSKGGLVTVRTCAALENNSNTACGVRDNFHEMEEKFTLEFCGFCTDELCNASVTSEISSILLFMLIAFAALIRLH